MGLPDSLSSFIRQNKEPIFAEWEAFAGTCLPGSEGMDILELRDHASLLLDWIASDLETHQTAHQKERKGKGLAGFHDESITITLL